MHAIVKALFARLAALDPAAEEDKLRQIERAEEQAAAAAAAAAAAQAQAAAAAAAASCSLRRYLARSHHTMSTCQLISPIIHANIFHLQVWRAAFLWLIVICARDA